MLALQGSPTWCSTTLPPPQKKIVRLFSSSSSRLSVSANRPVKKLPLTGFWGLDISSNTNIRFHGPMMKLPPKKYKSMAENEPLLPSTSKSKESWWMVVFIKAVLKLWPKFVRAFRKWLPANIMSICVVLLTALYLYLINKRKQTLWESIIRAIYCVTFSSQAKLKSFGEEVAHSVFAIVSLWCIYEAMTNKEYKVYVINITKEFYEVIERVLRHCFERNHIIICGDANHLYGLLKSMNCQYYPLTSRKYYICDDSKPKLDELSEKCSNDFNAIDLVTIRLGAYIYHIHLVQLLQPILKGTSIPIIVEDLNPYTSQLVRTFCDLNIEIVQDFTIKLLVQFSMPKSNYLNVIYMHLLKENGFNLFSSPNIVGISYKDIRKKFEGVVVCGIKQNGKMDFHPSEDEIIQEKDKVLFLGNITMGNVPKKNVKYPIIRSFEAHHLGQDTHLLVVGWRQDAASIINEYDKYLGPHSIVYILSDVAVNERKRALGVIGFKNLRVVHKIGDPMDDAILRKNILNIKRNIKYRSLSVIVISDREWNNEDKERSDYRNVYCLESIQKICEELRVDVDILAAQVSDLELGIEKQMIDSNPNLMYISTEEITSLVIAQVAKDKMLNGIWRAILKADEVKICLKDIELYMESKENLSFFELTERANLRREVAIGYLKNDKEVIINPDSKREPLCLDIISLVVICGQDS